MKRWVIPFALFTGLAVAADDSIKDVMSKAHKGSGSLLPTLGKELKADSPPWTDIQKQVKELVDLGETLAKNDPPKGEKASWKKQTEQYVKNAKALQDAAEKKNASDAKAAHAKLAGSCKACHQAHKG